jgi:hypothetical protein
MNGYREHFCGTVFCRGESMRPLFRPGDRIRFVPCRIEELRRGDVIVFVPPGKKERVVHRIVSCGPDGIRTKGDANPYADAWTLWQENIAGHVVFLERKGRLIPVAGGLAGRLFAACICTFRTCDHLASHVLHPCYRGLAESGLIRALLPPSLRPKVITFARDGAAEMQLVLGRRIIGRCAPGEATWEIRRPFRLFVQEDSLPVSNQAGRETSIRARL